MDERLLLTTLDNRFYVIKLYEGSNHDGEFKQGIYFPYSTADKNQTLERARDFGQTLANNIHATFEEAENI